MKALLVLLVLGVGGWAVWSYVVGPAIRAQAPLPTPTAVVHRPTATLTPLVGNQTAAASDVAQGFLSAWSKRRYDDMYDVLSPGARSVITATAFVARYNAIATVAGIAGVQPRLIATTVDANHATVTYTVDMSTTTVGAIHYTNAMPLHFDGNRWSVGWTPDLIFPGLGTGYLVHLRSEPAHRGAIVDRLGRTLAVQGQVLTVGVVPQYISDPNKLLSFLSNWLHMPAARISAMYHVAWAVAHPSWFVPITTVTSPQWDAVPSLHRQEMLDDGLDVQTGAQRRFYPQGALAGPLLGYVSSTDSNGLTGLEQWANPYLGGHDGALLEITNAPDYSYVAATIKERPKQDGATVHLTLDTTLQAAAEQALKGKIGSVVALDPATGAVLAMASAPGFDPGLFSSGDPANSAKILGILNSPHQPLINRAVLGQYPVGSVFKIIAMGAALEKLGFSINTTRFCAGIWTGLGAAYAKSDWLPQGHGWISLHEALVQSCDIYFYQVGQQLDQKDHYLLPDYARAWGFGAPTGIVGVPEGAGIIPDPHWTLTVRGQPWVPGNAVDMTIGQGYVEVTPLQVAQMLAALGDNGVMHRPYVVQRITAPDGRVVRDFAPVVTRKLPLSPDHLQAILDAMHGVTAEAYGTAADKFAGFPWPVAGKTGTAQAPSGLPYAWFVALAPADHPRIALVVMVEHGGEGSAVAAPLTRQILQTFFTQDRDLAGTGPSKGPPALPVP